ncbi:MAG: TIM barrel protein, partial [Desulfamplus sp.]|nr:TIM barrel protein [Desulfamplus sp.]
MPEPESIKIFPFKLATTSFIYPDRIVPNVIKLGSFFDEIELLIFESRPFIPKGDINGTLNSDKAINVLPSSKEIKQLSDLSQNLDVTYNIHLPVDVSLTDKSKSKRHVAIDTIKRVIELCAPLNPSTHTLHLEFNIDFPDYFAVQGVLIQDGQSCNNCGKAAYVHQEFQSNKNLSNAAYVRQGYLNRWDELEQDYLHRWRDLAGESLEKLSSFLSDPSIISIETLNYPFKYIDDIIEACGMSVCIDAGHLIRYGYSIEEVFQKHKTRIPLIHLHGVDFSSNIPKDHQAIDKT